MIRDEADCEGEEYWVRRLLRIGGRGGEEHTTHPNDLYSPLAGRERKSAEIKSMAKGLYGPCIQMSRRVASDGGPVSAVRKADGMEIAIRQQLKRNSDHDGSRTSSQRVQTHDPGSRAPGEATRPACLRYYLLSGP